MDVPPDRPVRADRPALPAPAIATLARVRRLVLALVGAGMIGLIIELALLAHDEDINQFIPFVVAATSVIAIAWHILRPHRASVRAVQAAMLITIIAGLTGVVLHYRANMEFQMESDPSLTGLTLMTKSLRAKSPPALAPGNMALLGLLGLAAVYRDR